MNKNRKQEEGEWKEGKKNIPLMNEGNTWRNSKHNCKESILRISKNNYITNKRDDKFNDITRNYHQDKGNYIDGLNRSAPMENNDMINGKWVWGTTIVMLSSKMKRTTRKIHEPIRRLAILKQSFILELRISTNMGGFT